MAEARGEGRTLVAVFDRPQQLATARNLLTAEGIDAERLAALVRPAAEIGGETPEEKEIAKNVSATATGAAVGSFFGTIFGPFFPIGTAAGALAGALLGLGIPPEEAEGYEGSYQAGLPILVVHAYPNEVDAVTRILNQAEAHPAPPRAARALASEAATAPTSKDVEPAAPRAREV